MLDMTQVTKVAVAGFGAAMASVFAIPEAHATIIPISFNPGSVAFVPLSGTTGTAAVRATAGTYGEVFIAGVFNSFSAKLIALSNNSSLAVEAVGTTFFGAYGGSRALFADPSAAGTDYVAFRTRDDHVGWFAVNWGGSGGAIRFLKGAYDTDMINHIIVGQMPTQGGGGDVPEPSELGLFALGLLALGAAGLRLRREARKASEPN